MEANKSKAQANKTATVLIIDDHPGNLALLSTQLGLEGYTILQADNGFSGIHLAQTHKPDLILLDVMMPDMNGFEVCRLLKQDPQTHLTPIILVTALHDLKDRIRGIEVGADEFLSRPYAHEELTARARTLIQLKQARTRLEEERNRLQLLNEISRAISSELELEKMMAQIIRRTQAAVGATKGHILLLDNTGKVSRRFTVRTGAPLKISDQITPEVLEKGLAGWLIREQRGDIITNIQQDARWIMLASDEAEAGSAVGVPLLRTDHTVGVLILSHPQPGYFTPEHLSLLETIGAQVAAAIENAALFAEVNEERRKMAAILAQSTDAILITDARWRISLLNQAAEELLKVQAADAVNRPLHEVAQLAPLIPLFGHARLAPLTQEITLNNHRIVYTSISPIQGVGYAVVMQDITQMKQAERQHLERERSEKQHVKELFARYMGPQLVNHVLSHEPGLMARRERRSAVVMYADLRNSTRGLLSRVTPHEAIEQLNEFFTSMMEIALSNNGTVFELTGDELLVGFNAPFNQPNAPFLALKTALMMQRQFNGLRVQWHHKLGTEVGLGIGIDQGDVVIGNVGAESRMSFRMVGEVMSRAHRLVDLAEDGQIVIAKSVFDTLQQQKPDVLKRVNFSASEPIALKGFDAPQVLYRAQIKRTPLPTTENHNGRFNGAPTRRG